MTQLSAVEIEDRVLEIEKSVRQRALDDCIAGRISLDAFLQAKMGFRDEARKMEQRDRRKVPAHIRRSILEAPCVYCGTWGSTCVDHVIPIAKGGTSDPANLVAACKSCNMEKLDFTPEEWRSWRESKGLCWPPPTLESRIAEIIKRVRS